MHPNQPDWKDAYVQRRQSEIAGQKLPLISEERRAAMRWGDIAMISIAAIGILLILAALYDALVPVTWGAL